MRLFEFGCGAKTIARFVGCESTPASRKHPHLKRRQKVGFDLGSRNRLFLNIHLAFPRFMRDGRLFLLQCHLIQSEFQPANVDVDNGRCECFFRTDSFQRKLHSFILFLPVSAPVTLVFQPDARGYVSPEYAI